MANPAVVAKWLALLVVMAAAAIAGGALAYKNVKNYRAYVAHELELLQKQHLFSARSMVDAFVAHQTLRGAATFARSDSPFETVRRGSWTRIAGAGERGSWRSGYFQKTKAMAVHGGLLCTGLMGQVDGDAEVWCFDGVRWTMLGGRGVNGSWEDHFNVHFLLSTGADLFAGVVDELWRWDGSTWHNLGSVSLPGARCQAYTGAVHNGALYLGTMDCGFRMFKYDDAGFRLETFGLGADEARALNVRYNGLYQLHRHADGKLYVGTVANFGSTSIFYIGDQDRLTGVGGDGLNGSWINPGFSFLLNFSTYKDKLIAVMARTPMVAGKFSPVWAYDGKEWQPVGQQQLPQRWHDMINFNASNIYRDRLIVGGGGLPAGNASAWILNDAGQFEELGGHGVNGSWGKPGQWQPMIPGHSAEYIYRFLVWEDKLVAGFGDGVGMAQIWIYEAAG